MIKNLIFILAILTAFSAKAQHEDSYKHVDSVMLAIPDPFTYSSQDISDYVNTHFTEDKDKLRAIFIWVASNISYDVYDQRDYIPAGELEEYIRGTLVSRKGKCQGYAELFHDICSKSGLQSRVVSGLAKAANDENPDTHAWVMASSSSSWKLYDPTFGSGYLMQREYFKEIDNTYYETTPEVLIKSHYPFDPLWQLLPNPINLETFFEINNDTSAFQSAYFNYPDSIQTYTKLSEYQKLIQSRIRIEKYGAGFEYTKNYLKNIDDHIEYYKNTKIVNTYNLCVEDYNTAVGILNSSYQNQQLTNLNTSQKQSHIHELDSLQMSLSKSQATLKNLESDEESMIWGIIELKHALGQLSKQVKQKKAQLENS